MRMNLPPEQLMSHLLNSESFDDLVSYRLQMSLDSCVEDLERMSKIKAFEPYQFEDYVEILRYCRALVVVLGWLCTESLEPYTVKLNQLSVRINNEF